MLIFTTAITFCGTTSKELNRELYAVPTLKSEPINLKRVLVGCEENLQLCLVVLNRLHRLLSSYVTIFNFLLFNIEKKVVTNFQSILKSSSNMLSCALVNQDNSRYLE